MFKLPIDKLDALFAAVASASTLYLPVDGNDGRASYKKWSEGTKMSKALNTVRSAKDFFFPQTQNLCDFNVKGQNIEIIDNRTESEDFVVFGVRACDARSFTILDKVFLADPVDSYYAVSTEPLLQWLAPSLRKTASAACLASTLLLPRETLPAGPLRTLFTFRQTPKRARSSSSP